MLLNKISNEYIPINSSELFNSKKKHNVEFSRKCLGYVLKSKLFLGFVNLNFTL